MVAPMNAPKWMTAGSPSTVGMETLNASFRLSARKSAPSSGLKMFSTSELTMAVNAAPITTATARSITLPRRMNSLKPLSMGSPCGSGMGRTLATLPAQDVALPAEAGVALEPELEEPPEEEDPPLVSEEDELDDPSEDFEEAGMELEPLPAPARESVR
ncbi:hypothetical protein PLANTIT3_60533 [Plantibacter sp. T3]|nr:hypothetical protein PLANTIT3_60533 [Plantibacter sp. T3]